MRRKLGKLCIGLGSLCIAAALVLLLYNYREEHRAEEISRQLVPALEEVIAERNLEPEEGDAPASDPEPGITLDGAVYLGWLDIPALDLQLPVRAEWSYPALKQSPCRYTGSAAAGGFVIAAHNYRRHFAYISSLAVGDPVVFTDANGTEYFYEVSLLETLSPYSIEEMTDAHWDLTLFTCTYGGKSRVTVRCTKVDGIVEVPVEPTDAGN